MRQLTVLGGGGFLMEKSRALDRYFLAATGKLNPRICFIDDELVHVVASRPAANAYRVTFEQGAVVDAALPVRVLD